MNDQQGLTNGCLASLEEDDYYTTSQEDEEEEIIEEFENHVKTVYNGK